MFDAVPADEYDHDDPPMKPIRLVDLDDLSHPEVLATIESDMERNLYASHDWSIRFYLTIAWHGFIAVAYEQREGAPPLLLPEMQFSYAHLTLSDMHVSTKARKRSSRYRLRLNGDLDGVLAGIQASHDSWVLPKYQELLRILHRRPVRVPVEGGSFLHVNSIELIDSESGVLVAGEVGYTIGAVYTSLTGFFDRASTAASASPAEPSAKPRIAHSSAGTVQLVALGSLLRSCGFHFWNLGHPPRRATPTREGRMWYKAELGARVYPRPKFLEAWKLARSELPAQTLHEALPPEGVGVRELLQRNTRCAGEHQEISTSTGTATTAGADIASHAGAAEHAATLTRPATTGSCP